MDKENDVLAREAIRRQFSVLSKLKDKTYETLVIDIWLEGWRASKWDDIIDCPSNPKLPGLPIVRQANTVSEMAITVSHLMSSRYDELVFDTDLLIVGGLLLDASKIVEMEPDIQQGGAKFSRLASVMPHAVYAAHQALKHNSSDEIVNIILSHTRHIGAKPISLEAIVLHYVDYMVADCMRFTREAPLLMMGPTSYG